MVTVYVDITIPDPWISIRISDRNWIRHGMTADTTAPSKIKPNQQLHRKCILNQMLEIRKVFESVPIGLKIPRPQGHVGSIPTSGTKKNKTAALWARPFCFLGWLRHQWCLACCPFESMPACGMVCVKCDGRIEVWNAQPPTDQVVDRHAQGRGKMNTGPGVGIAWRSKLRLRPRCRPRQAPRLRLVRDGGKR